MPGEVGFDWTTGKTMYFQIIDRLSGGMRWNGSAFETYTSLSGNIASYANACTQQGNSPHYVGNFPGAVPPGSYDVATREKVNAFYAETDPAGPGGQVEWGSGKIVPLSSLLTSGGTTATLPIKGNMILNFTFPLVSSVDHITPFVSGSSVSGSIKQDAGLFGPLQSGAFTNVGRGWYNVQALTSGDMNANVVALEFRGSDASGALSDITKYTFILNPHPWVLNLPTPVQRTRRQGNVGQSALIPPSERIA